MYDIAFYFEYEYIYDGGEFTDVAGPVVLGEGHDCQGADLSGDVVFFQTLVEDVLGECWDVFFSVSKCGEVDAFD